jgi:hypothetical protein
MSTLKLLNAKVSKKKFKHIFLALLTNVLATILHILFLVYSYMLFPWFLQYPQYLIDPSFYTLLTPPTITPTQSSFSAFVTPNIQVHTQIKPGFYILNQCYPKFCVHFLESRPHSHNRSTAQCVWKVAVHLGYSM